MTRDIFRSVSALVAVLSVIFPSIACVWAAAAAWSRCPSSNSLVNTSKLRSNEIPEFLIAGFERRPNSVEVIVNARGAVERVRMLGTPQRIPDIMLLSRVKEWLFDPATRDGAAVRYRMILTWNVTP